MKRGTIRLGTIAGILRSRRRQFPAAALRFDIPVMVAVVVTCLPSWFTGNAIARREGGPFLGYCIARALYVILGAARANRRGMVRQRWGDEDDHEGEHDETVGAVRAGPGQLPTRLSEDLQEILKHAGGKGVTIGKVMDILAGRGLDVLVIILALPFCTPVPLPGLSTPFGLVLMFCGLRIALRRRPWLPRRLLEVQIPYPTLSKIIKAGLAISARLEKVLHPRWRFVKDWASFSFLNGLAILSSAFVLSLPLPVPLTNALPASSMVLVAAGMMEDDGAAIMAGYLMSGLAWLYLASLVWVGQVGLTWMGS